MGNFSMAVRVKRWTKFFVNYLWERMRGLDFSMLYVGELQRTVDEFHGYSMTDAGDMKRMLQAVPVDPARSAFIDVGCGKGMCMKCAVEVGYKKVAGLDLDQHLLGIATQNMKKLKMSVDCIFANAVDFANYADYDVFYFYNPFGRTIFEQVANKIKESQEKRNRDIWVIYYHPVYADVFDKAGFLFQHEVHDKTRDATSRFYLYPKKEQ